MTDKKTPKPNQNKQAKSKKKKQNRAKSRALTKRLLPTFAISLLDPFNDAARGARVPDADMSSSTAFNCIYRTSPTTDGTYGSVATVFSPDPGSCCYTSATVTSAIACTWAANWTAQSTPGNITPIRTAIAVARCTGFGVRISGLEAETAAKGKIHVAHFPVDYSETSLNTALPTTVGNIATLPGYQCYPISSLDDGTLEVVGRPMDASAFRYRSTAQPWNIGSAEVVAGLESSIGWMHIIVFIEGANTSVVPVQLHALYHYEGISKPGENLMADEPPPPYQPNTMAAITNLAAATPTARVIPQGDLYDGDWIDKIERGFNVAYNIVSRVAPYAGTIADIATQFL